MANAEHLKILDLGYKEWNSWRTKNPEIKVDLKNAYLVDRGLEWFNFNDADLREANFTWTSFRGAHLHRANLCKTILDNASLRDADLTKAELIEASLINAYLNQAICKEARFEMANLTEAILTGAKLCQASITGARLFGTARDEWKIDDIKCEYVFWDKNAEFRTPRDRVFEPNEFERLYASIPTIEMIFEKGMTLIDPVALELAVHKITEKKPEWNLELRAIDRWGIYPKAVFTILLEGAKEQAQGLLKERYEKELSGLKNDKHYLQQALQLALQRSPQITFEKPRIALNDFHEAHGDIQINIVQAVNDIKSRLETVPEESFKNKSKKQVIEHLDEIAKEASKVGAKVVGKKLLEFAKSELVPIIPNIMTFLSQ